MHGAFKPNHMTTAQYEAERARLREVYGDNRQEAGARFEQELARLFYRSGWTQEALGKREGKTQQWVALKLRFGRFLEFTTAVVNSETPPPANLTEGAFRKLWERTDKAEANERIRFDAVVKLLSESSLYPPPKSPITKAHITPLADGKWHRLDAMAQQLGHDEEHVNSAINTHKKHGNIRVETKRVGKDSAGNGPTTSYRMFRTNRTVSLDELATKLGPILEGLEVEGKKNMATMSPTTVAMLAGRLKRLIEDWEK